MVKALSSTLTILCALVCGTLTTPLVAGDERRPVPLEIEIRATQKRIRELYNAADRGGWCLDYYAANNEAEYFGQGVEAFVSLGKRPGREVTHGHTRFELYRVDPALYEFIESVVDFDRFEARRRDSKLTAKRAPRSVSLHDSSQDGWRQLLVCRPPLFAAAPGIGSAHGWVASLPRRSAS